MQWIRPCINECEAFPLRDANQNLRCIKYTQFLEYLKNYQLLRKVKSEVEAVLRNPVFWTTISSYLFSLAKPYSGVILFRRECNFSWLVQLLWRWHNPWKQLRHFVLIATTAWSNLLPPTTFPSRHNALCVNLTSILVGLISDLFLPNKEIRRWRNLASHHKMGNNSCFSSLRKNRVEDSSPVGKFLSVGWYRVTDVSGVDKAFHVRGDKMPKKPYIRQNFCENLAC